jgi:hypothetical protein
LLPKYLKKIPYIDQAEKYTIGTKFISDNRSHYSDELLALVALKQSTPFR